MRDPTMFLGFERGFSFFAVQTSHSLIISLSLERTLNQEWNIFNPISTVLHQVA